MLKPVAAFFFLAISILPSFAEAGCPVINGRFVFDTTYEGRARRFVYTLYTRQEQGVFSYTVNKEGLYQVADGVARPIRIGDRTGKVRVFCVGENSVVQELTADDTGGVASSRLTPVSQSKIHIESDDPARTGIYIQM